MLEEWFWSWLQYHQKLHPHRSWVPPHDTDFYAGWMEAFARCRADEELARTASRRLQERGSPYPSKHLEAVVGLVRELRREWDLSPPPAPIDPGRERCEHESRDCPECKGKGWARRRVLFAWLGVPAVVVLFCRCPLGRWLKDHDPDLTRPPHRRRYDDLQARPELWDPELSFPAWSWRSVPPDLEIDDTGGPWRYLKPGEDAPAARPPRLPLRKVKDVLSLDAASPLPPKSPPSTTF